MVEYVQRLTVDLAKARSPANPGSMTEWTSGTSGRACRNFAALSYPGRADTAGAWYYISAIGWFGFMLTFVVFIVLAVVATVHRSSGRRRAVSS